jgi:hypothetical protein
LALVQRAAELVLESTQYDLTEILAQTIVTQTILVGTREDIERMMMGGVEGEDLERMMENVESIISSSPYAARRAAAGQDDDLCPKSSASVHAWARTTAVFTGGDLKCTTL